MRRFLLLAAALLSAMPLAAPAQMLTDPTIPYASLPLSGTELFSLVQGGKTVKTTVSSIPAAKNTLPTVATEAALASTPTSFAPAILRLDYSAGLGAPPLVYLGEAGTCAANGFVNDGGNCINSPPTDGNSWIARFPASGADIREWGANPSADSSAAVQAAFNASPYYGVLTVPAEIIPVGSTIACTHPVKIAGAEGKPSNQPAFYDGFSGFKPTAANETLFDLQNGCSGSRFDSFYVQMDAAGQNASGATFQEDPSSNIDFSYVAVQGACIAFDTNGNGQSFSHVMATQVTGAGCAGIRIGYQTTNGNTVDTHVSDSVFQGCPVLNPDGSVATACANNSSAAQATAGMLVLDGNPIVHGNDILYFVNGTKIFPGANQYVNAFTGDNTVLGDTTSGAPLVIATNATTAKVQQFKCSLCWVAAYKSAAGTPGVSINNSGGGIINGVHFATLTDYSVGGDGIDIVGTTTEPLDTTIDASVICGMGSQGGSYDGLNVGFGVNDVTVRNTKISGSCDGSNNGAMQYAVLLAGNNNTIVLTSDNLYGWTSQAVSGEPSQCSGNTCSSIIANNLGVDDQTPAIASAATIDPGVYPNVEISGTATVTTINGCWSGRHLTMRPSGAVVFATGGNLSNGLTATVPVPVEATGFGTNPCMWALK